jgi:hypothetical protein
MWTESPCVVPLLAGLAVDGDRDGGGGLRHGGHPLREGIAELLEREPGQGAADGRGVWRLLAREAQGALEGLPMVGSPALEGGEVGLAAAQAEERQGEHGREGVAHAPPPAGITDQGECIEAGGKCSGHP